MAFPKQIKFHGGHTYLAIPVPKLAPEMERALSDKLREICVDQFGEGQCYRPDDNGVRFFELFVEDGTCGVTGDWLVRYSLDDETGVDLMGYDMAALLTEPVTT